MSIPPNLCASRFGAGLDLGDIPDIDGNRQRPAPGSHDLVGQGLESICQAQIGQDQVGAKACELQGRGAADPALSAGTGHDGDLAGENLCHAAAIPRLNDGFKNIPQAR